MVVRRVVFALADLGPMIVWRSVFPAPGRGMVHADVCAAEVVAGAGAGGRGRGAGGLSAAGGAVAGDGAGSVG